MEQSKEDNIKINIKDDGVYIFIKKSNNFKISKSDILELIQVYGIKDVDISAISNIFKIDDKIINIKISNNINISNKDEQALVIISKDYLKAEIKFFEALLDGKNLSIEQIKEKLDEANIKNGILEEELEKICKNKKYNYAYLIAESQPPINGVNGYIKIHFETTTRSKKPKILQNGKVDYQNLDLIVMSNKDDILASIVPAEAGKDGLDILGRIIPCKQGTEAPLLPKGKNVSISDDNMHLTADVSGQVVYSNKKISVFEMFRIKGNVDNSTGNINFNGSVIVDANVNTGFCIDACGDIVINGIVEGATLRSESNIYLKGVQGCCKAVIEANGDIHCKYIENAKLICAKNLFAKSIIHSDVVCYDSLEISGKNAVFLGGTACIKNNMLVQNLGSSMGTSTNIEIGNDPELVEKYNIEVESLNKLKIEFDEIYKNIETIKKKIDRNLLDSFRQQQLDNLLDVLIKQQEDTKQNIILLEKNVHHTLKKLDAYAGSITVFEKVYPGVNILIGNSKMYIKDEIENAVFVNSNGKIKIIKE